MSTDQSYQDDSAAGAVVDVDAAWREAVNIAYDDHVIQYGNDGPYECDRFLPDGQRARLDTLVDLIAARTRVPAEFIRKEMNNAAYAYGQAPGTDDDPDYFAPPDWKDLVDQVAAIKARATRQPHRISGVSSAVRRASAALEAPGAAPRIEPRGSTHPPQGPFEQPAQRTQGRGR